MKKFCLAITLAITGFFAGAQSSNVNPIPEDFIPGSILLSDNNTLEGHIRNNLKKNGEIVFLYPNGSKKKFNAGNIIGFKTSNTNYIVINNTFFRLIEDGSKIRLLRKASNPSGIQYNGSEAVSVGTTEGSYDDYFIQTISTKKLQLVRKKDFAKVFGAVCADCNSLNQDIKANKIGFENIEQAVAAYNGCAN